jgi:hypothetical protein
MDDTTSKDQAEGEKRPYVKPEIQEVPLRPDEAVLGGCKTSSTSGSAQHRCNTPSACSALTS